MVLPGYDINHASEFKHVAKNTSPYPRFLQIAPRSVNCPYCFMYLFLGTLIFVHEGRGLREIRNDTMRFRIKLSCHALAGNLSVVAFK